MPKASLVIACDPGNESAGVSFWYVTDTVLELSHLTVHIWSKNGYMDLITAFRHVLRQTDPATRIYFAYESPVNGTHTSRAGVARSTGQIIGYLYAVCGIRRDDTYAIPVSAWRSATYTQEYTTDGYKKAALDAAAKDQEQVESHDEAEARLIGKYFCKKLMADDLVFKPVRRPRVKKSSRKSVRMARHPLSVPRRKSSKRSPKSA